MSNQTDFLAKALAHAELARHMFPEYAACEAALESAWGKSRLAREANNLFGEHQHHVPIYETYVLHPNDNVDPNDDWIKFPSWKECFESRMDTLHRLAAKVYSDGKPQYPHYVAALAAPDGETFVKEVSQTWAQDPTRAEHVLQIHRAHFKATGEIV